MARQSGHSRLKAALVLRDALAADLGLPLRPVMAQLATVETNIGTAKALDQGQYLDAASSLCHSDQTLLAACDGQVRVACTRVGLAPRYAQYLALLLFSHWMNWRQQDSTAFLVRLNEYLSAKPPRHQTLSPFTPTDLQYAAFWMATAAGKTHVLHAVLALLTENQSADWDRIILSTPSESLTRQHADRLRALRQWDVFAYPMDGDATALGRRPKNTIIVLDINKLTEIKQGEGLRIATSVFQGGRNLLLVDEGHKGQRAEKSLWKKLQQDVAGIDAEVSDRRGMLVEFSATFGQVAELERAFDRYAKSVIFDYAYDRFHADLYGKDFWHVKLDAQSDAVAIVQQQTLTAALVAYWHQLQVYRNPDTQALLHEQQLVVATPLWVLLGLSVIGGDNKNDQKQTSDVIEVLTFLAGVLSDPAVLIRQLNAVLSDSVRRTDVLPSDVRAALRGQSAAVLAQKILVTVFGWQSGDKPVFRLLRSSAGELGLGLLRGDRVRYFGVVNVGNAGGLQKALTANGLRVDDDVLTESLFAGLNDGDSGVNLLIGSRRFAEGWDNYRASSLTLLRLGSGEGSLIIQMFGRVVRFAGIHNNGKRLAEPGSVLRPLQTAYVYGLRSGYLEDFLNGLYANGVPVTQTQRCPIRLTLPDAYSLQSVQAISPDPNDFQVRVVGDNWLNTVNKVKVSLGASISTARLSLTGVTATRSLIGQDVTRLFKQWIPLLDVDALYLEMLGLKRQQRWWNLVFDQMAVQAALDSDQYQVFGLPDALSLNSASDLLRLQRTASSVVRRLFESAYRKQENHHCRYVLVDAKNSGLPSDYRKEILYGQED